MTIKRILCHIDGGDDSESTLQTALTVGRDLGACVEVYHVELDPQYAVPLAADGMTATMIEEIVETVEKESSKRAGRARQLYDQLVQHGGVPAIEAGGEVPPGFAATFRTERGREHELVAQRGMLFDLLVLSRRHGEGEPPATPTLETAIMESGRPILVAPQRAPGALGKHIAVAWRATVPGVHALTGAMPLLERAEQATVITVDEGHTEADPGDIVGYLGYHGVRAAGRHVKAGGREAGQAILEEAASAGADMLVMGAYAHSRLRQLILGGVTSTVLRSASMPLLLAH
jgi:nucleotide-binding universal stress UspA family protein